MTVSEQTMATLAAKLDAFALTLSAPEQVLLAELISDDDSVVGFGARPIWPGLAQLRPESLVPPDTPPTSKPGGFVDIVMGGTDI